jgi:hypothetical protein
MRHFFATALLLASSGQALAAADPATLSCPTSIQTSETVIPPTPFRMDPSQTTTRGLLRASVLNIEGGDEFELKPDQTFARSTKTILVWNLDSYRAHKLVLRCRYRDSGVKLSVDIPSELHRCEATLTLTRRNRIAGTSTVQCK